MNGEYKIIEVKNKKTIHEFLHLPVRLYKHDKNWIRPLDKDIEEVFDPAKNKLFRSGEAIRWILADRKNQTIGRVAAFINPATATRYEIPVGGMGFFECIRDRKAAFTLFDQCKNWLDVRGMKAMDGPINFGERNFWLGLLVDGFYEPGYCIPYNPLYYKNFFEEYGFKNFFNQYIYYRKVEEKEISPKLKERGLRLSNNPHYSFSYLPKKRFGELAEMIREIYNKAWAKFPGVRPLSSTHAKALVNNLKPVLDEKLLWFGYFDGEPISFFLMIPEINQIIKHLNGKLHPVNKLRFLYYKNIKRVITKAIGILFAVVPKHQRKGVEAAMILAFSKLALTKQFRYTELEMNWIGDFNPTMMKILKQIGATIYKTYVTYRYLFDPSAVFVRASQVKQ